MANDSIRGDKKTPGVYDKVNEIKIPSTSNVAVTALGLVGETQKGPAFAIQSIDSWTKFKSVFGGTSTEKFKGNNFPKYELPYIAKEFLTESNNLYVSRILGLSGYDAGRAWGVILSGNTIDNALVGVIRNKGTLQAGQTINWSISEEETLYSSDINLTDSFTIDVVTSDSVADVDVNLNLAYLTGIGYKNGVKLATNPSNGSTIDIVGGVFSGVVVLTGVTETTIPSEENETVVISATYTSGTLTFPNGVTFNMYDTPLQSSVTISTTNPVTITNVSFASNGEIIVSTGSTVILSGCTVSYFLKDKEGLPISEISLDSSDSNFILNVLGTKIDDVDGQPIWVDEFYLDGYDWATLIADDSIKIKLIELPKQQFNNFKSRFGTPRTPWIVSQIVGGNVKDLFRFVAISDGESANTEIKVSIENVDTVTKTFDVIIRSFGDTDDNSVVLESYRSLNLIKDDKSYIGKKIGDAAGEYTSNSTYVMVEIADGSLQNESPSGFKGFPIRINEGYTYPTPNYKTGFIEDIKPRRQTLGIQSTSSATFDFDFLKYKGINTTTGYDWGTFENEQTKGFHIQSEALALTGYTVPTTSVFVDPDTGEAYSDDEIKLRYKFTTMFHSGFDGWNIYSTERGLSSDYRYNKTQGKAGLNNGTFNYFSDNDFPEGTKAITSDYYAYYKGFRTFANPKDVEINLLATPGIDWVNQASLCDEVITMIEDDRCDALYLCNTADSTDNTVASLYTPKEISSMFTDAGFDTKFATTFYPWIQIADSENDNKYMWVSPIKDLARAIAYTDNNKYPWFAPVGYARGTVNALRARTKLKVADTEYLVNAGLNYVETFGIDGLKLWGQKLMRKNADDYVISRIGVQRLMLYLRGNIRSVVVKDTFEQNDDIIVSTLRKQITPILSGVAGQRGIEKDYVLDVYQTPEDKDLRQARVKVYLKPIGAIEYIEVEFNVNPNGVSFV